MVKPAGGDLKYVKSRWSSAPAPAVDVTIGKSRKMENINKKNSNNFILIGRGIEDSGVWRERNEKNERGYSIV